MSRRPVAKRLAEIPTLIFAFFYNDDMRKHCLKQEELDCCTPHLFLPIHRMRSSWTLHAAIAHIAQSQLADAGGHGGTDMARISSRVQI